MNRAISEEIPCWDNSVSPRIREKKCVADLKFRARICLSSSLSPSPSTASTSMNRAISEDIHCWDNSVSPRIREKNMEQTSYSRIEYASSLPPSPSTASTSVNRATEGIPCWDDSVGPRIRETYVADVDALWRHVMRCRAPECTNTLASICS
jgi:hypothetical protein